jgi:RNA polymerase sigma-70 factor (ECF subfamily)
VGTAGVFEEHRSLLFTIAYEITGTVTDAEDVVQESFLRWSGVDADSVRLVHSE